MNDCKRIRNVIDQSERPGVLAYEAERHLSDCASCREFADERTNLREMLASAARVPVPSNYDAMLRAKLDQAQTAKTFSWLSPIGYMQIGAATAGIIIVIAAAQYTGLFSNSVQSPVDTEQHDGELALLPGRTSPSPSEKAPDVEIAPAPQSAQASTKLAKRRVSSYSPAKDRETIDVDPSFVILMGQDGETRVSVPTVGVGAQPILMSSSQPSASAVRTSF